jgi:alcohol dehydrogenase (cytochrome c)
VGAPRVRSLARRLTLLLVAAGALAPAALAADAGRPGDWTAFGRSPDNLRHSPLREITPANVGGLRPVYTLDFRQIDPDVRRGQQSYPLAIGGRLFVTTNDGNVFAIDGASGRILWQYKPRASAVFKNFGIVANRGLAYCGGRLFLAQLDMKLVALRPSDGRVLRTIAIEHDVPDASANHGYSQTSAPVCANGRVVLGAAGSEYGIRGFVMAWTTDLRPAWPAPHWTIPPDGQSWRRSSRIVGGGAVWTPVTIDAASNTVYFGTGASTPHYFPSLRPGENPRTSSLVAIDLRSGRIVWWRQLVARNQWGYDVAQPPLVYTAEIGGEQRRVVSVATMEGVWFAFDARTGQPLHDRVRVIDRVEHPSLRPGRPVLIYPATLGGLNYSPAAFDPGTGYVVNAAAETASVMIQQRLSPTQKRRKLLLGDVFLGLSNGDFGQILPNWKDHGSISAIDVGTGRRVWKFRTPEPERGGVTTTATGLGFAGGGDGVVRAFDLRSGKVLWQHETGAPIAAGATVFAAGGRQHVAITVGGTPTSSNGGTASKLVVYALRSPEAAPQRPHSVTTGPATEAAPTREPASGPARFAVAGGAVELRLWRPTSSNLAVVRGRLVLRGRPVAGVRVALGRHVLARATDETGGFSVAVDPTLPRRYALTVIDTASARVGGRRPSPAERAAIARAAGGVNVGYSVAAPRARVRPDGSVLVTGRLVRADGIAAPPVTLLSYRLAGTITAADGSPVAGATVVTRTLDRNYWTFSAPSDSQGRYESFFPASDELGSSPVPISVQVAAGRTSYASGDQNVTFERLRSARMDVRLPSSGTALPVPTATSEPGAIYRGVVVGVSVAGRPLRPVSARWPDARGRFSLVLRAAARGKRVSFWQAALDEQFAAAAPGGAVDMRGWPALPATAPRDLAFVDVPRAD